MDVLVMMSSGEGDEWSDVHDVVTDAGMLIVLDKISDGDDTNSKILHLTREEEQYPTSPSFNGRLEPPMMMKVSEAYRVVVQYAAGMWMKVEYDVDA